jgi:hypothetical protein
MRPLLTLLACSCLLIAARTLAAPAPPSPTRGATRPGAPAPRSAARAPHTPDRRAELDRDTLAWVGERAITALDLVQRIEWMPWSEKRSAANMDSAKVRALRSLAAEALLARESDRRAPNGSDAFVRAREALRRALARDALFNDLASSSPPPTPAEVTALAKRMHPEARAEELPQWRRMATDSLRALAGQQRAAQFLVAHLAGKRVDVDSAAFMMLADTLRAYMVASQDAPAVGGGIVVPGEAPDMLLSALAPALDRTLARLPDGPLTLGDALEDMRFYLFVVPSLRPGRFAASLSAQLKLLVEGEIMGREALRRHMDERPEARHDLRLWSDAWRASSVLVTIPTGGPAGDDEAFRAFALADPERARDACEVDLEEILCATAGEAGEVRAALDAGAPFDSLARRHSRRVEWAGNGGRSGFFPVALHPELGFTALLSPVDVLFGPGHLPEGYSIYRVRGKRLAPDSVQARELLENARAIATGQRRSDVAARYIGSLASGVRIRFADAALARVDILPSNMVVRRTLGFGGGMTAAPSLPPLWEWTKYWNGGRPALP